MIAVPFDGCNLELNKPYNMSDEECGSCPAYFGDIGGGYAGFVIALQPNKEDIEAINAGRPIFVKVLSRSFAPMVLYTLDENNNPNQ